MQLTILPLKGVGDVEFGMSRDQVRAHVGGKFQSFKRAPREPFPCDYSENVSAFFYYDSEGRLEAVEFAAPARPTVMGIALLGLDFEAACANLRAIDNQVEEEGDGAISFRVGVSIYAPLAKGNRAAPVESVLAFRPGYYN